MLFTSSRFYKALMFLGIIGVLDTVYVLGILGIGINFGTLFPGVLGSLFLSAGILNVFFGLDPFGLKNTVIRRVYLIIFTLWLISFLLIEGLIFKAAHSDKAVTADYLIVLGAAIHGETMSLTLSYRMDTVLQYLQENPSAKVIVSGGQGPGESITEAEAMKRFLVANHISEDRILKEERSTSTLENLRFSKAILLKETKVVPKVMVVTNDFHVFRARMLAGRVGLKVYGLPAKTPLPILVNVYGREYLAIIKSYLMDH